jgi:hypothetical protein
MFGYLVGASNQWAGWRCRCCGHSWHVARLLDVVKDELRQQTESLLGTLLAGLIASATLLLIVAH